jgi:hypothetical protein
VPIVDVGNVAGGGDGVLVSARVGLSLGYPSQIVSAPREYGRGRPERRLPVFVNRSPVPELAWCEL